MHDKFKSTLNKGQASCCHITPQNLTVPLERRNIAVAHNLAGTGRNSQKLAPFP